MEIERERERERERGGRERDSEIKRREPKEMEEIATHIYRGLINRQI